MYTLPKRMKIRQHMSDTDLDQRCMIADSLVIDSERPFCNIGQLRVRIPYHKYSYGKDYRFEYWDELRFERPELNYDPIFRSLRHIPSKNEYRIFAHPSNPFRWALDTSYIVGQSETMLKQLQILLNYTGFLRIRSQDKYKNMLIDTPWRRDPGFSYDYAWNVFAGPRPNNVLGLRNAISHQWNKTKIHLFRPGTTESSRFLTAFKLLLNLRIWMRRAINRVATKVYLEWYHYNPKGPIVRGLKRKYSQM